MSVNSMTSAEVDNKFCANCKMHNWKQPDDKNSLEPCRRCRKILYCGRACRKEHWEKVHKNHCQFLANPSQCPQSEHDAETCHDCRQLAKTGKGKPKVAVKAKKRNPASSSYECIAKYVDFTPSIASPHPFPLAGVEEVDKIKIGFTEDLLEKSVIVMQKLVHKIKPNPQAAKACSAELDKMEQALWGMRIGIWRQRKIFPEHISMMDRDYMDDMCQIVDLFESILDKVSHGKAGKDASEIWKIVQVVLELLRGPIDLHYRLDLLKNPSESLPQPFQDSVKQAKDNKIQVLGIAKDVLDSLSTQVVSYEDIIKKLCGGKKKQNCSFCGVKAEIAEYLDKYRGNYAECSYVSLDSVSIRKFWCGSKVCEEEVIPYIDEMFKFKTAVTTACAQQEPTCCDFCFKFCPSDKAHRCRNCFTVVYCSKDCHKNDKEHRFKYCEEDERKTKADDAKRRQAVEVATGQMASAPAEFGLPENEVNLLNETLEAFGFQEDNPDTGEK